MNKSGTALLFPAISIISSNTISLLLSVWKKLSASKSSGMPLMNSIQLQCIVQWLPTFIQVNYSLRNWIDFIIFQHFSDKKCLPRTCWATDCHSEWVLKCIVCILSQFHDAVIHRCLHNVVIFVL